MNMTYCVKMQCSENRGYFDCIQVSYIIVLHEECEIASF